MKSTFVQQLIESIQANVTNPVYLKEYSGTQLGLFSHNDDVPSFEGAQIKINNKGDHKEFVFGPEFSDEVEISLNPENPQDTTKAEEYVAQFLYGDDEGADDLAKALDTADKNDILIFNPSNDNKFAFPYGNVTQYYAKFKRDDRAAVNEAVPEYEDDLSALDDRESDWMTMWKDSQLKTSEGESFGDYMNRLKNMY